MSAENEPHCSACNVCHEKPVCYAGTVSSRQERERQGTRQQQGMGGVIKFRMHALPNFFVCLMALGFFYCSFQISGKQLAAAPDFNPLGVK